MKKDTATRRAQIRLALRLLDRHYPRAACALHFATPFQLLVATVLSAQCTDQRVNQITPALFASYPDAPAMAAAPRSAIERLIRSAGLFRSKAKSIRALSQQLTARHGGQVPPQMELLRQLPGVGRKTANVVLGNALDIASGIAVDTHVARLSQRLGWTRHTDPKKIEFDLLPLIPKKRWVAVNHQLIAHGRAICTARVPRCADCFLHRLCPTGNRALSAATPRPHRGKL